MRILGMRPGFAAGLFSILAFLFVFLLWPVHPHHVPANRTICLSNVKQIGLGHIIYMSDYDERFTPLDWVPPLAPYIKDKSVYRCPSVKEGDSGYAYNSLLAGKILTEKDPPEKIALTFEVDDLRLGVVAERVVPLASKRHEETLTVGFADGHAKRMPFGQIGKIWMQPEKVSAKVSAN